MPEITDLRQGSKIVLRPGFGNDPPIEVVVDDVFQVIKNDRPGLTYDDGTHWAYLHQVDRVLEY